jgi:hypothetical protein
VTGRELIRKAMAALQHAGEARTVEFQARHADEARILFDRAVRSARIRFEAAERRPTVAARVIARHAVAYELSELYEFEQTLAEVEARIAGVIETRTDPRDYRRLRLAD